MVLKSALLSKLCYDLGYTCSFNIDTEFDTLPCYRAVTLSSQNKTADGEAITDNGVVVLPSGANSVGPVIGVVTWEGTNLPYPEGTLSVVPSTLKDANVTVVLDKTYILEVAPGEVIAKGSFINVNGVGQAAAVGTATGFLAMGAATGVGTVDNPEYIIVEITRLTA